ncbi:MAG: NADH-quinone oxidoreductase subunit J, partial [Bacteroidia bacterium]|nr:NADH-quinone oxidoreductase subunit J [Bacteroidia bacterium]
LYVIMMLNLNRETESHKKPYIRFIAVITAGLLMITLIAAFKVSEVSITSSGITDAGTVKNLGRVLFDEFLLPFEISSVLFLAAMVGAVYLSKKQLH